MPIIIVYQIIKLFLYFIFVLPLRLARICLNYFLLEATETLGTGHYLVFGGGEGGRGGGGGLIYLGAGSLFF